ncbi:hypothetical protein M0804_008578 [Polistes exclamans]|nr:hypothetical protein M0804_008578 [Polistes exclamans]
MHQRVKTQWRTTQTPKVRDYTGTRQSTGCGTKNQSHLALSSALFKSFGVFKIKRNELRKRRVQEKRKVAFPFTSREGASSQSAKRGKKGEKAEAFGVSPKLRRRTIVEGQGWSSTTIWQETNQISGLDNSLAIDSQETKECRLGRFGSKDQRKLLGAIPNSRSVDWLQALTNNLWTLRKLADHKLSGPS